MNALIHPLDRVVTARQSFKPPGLLLRAWRRLSDAFRQSQERRAMIGLSDFDAHLLRDIGLTPDDVRTYGARRLSDGRWIITNTRLGER
jgi:uncharacterized protein YjiS (DUF1127 family)